MMRLEHHPAADAFPMMDQSRYVELRDSIATGYTGAHIKLYEGKILDGRNRYKACVELGIDAPTDTYEGDPWMEAWKDNGIRRDLVADQRYLIWEHCAEQSEAWVKTQQAITDEANRARSAKARAQPRNDSGTFEPVVQQPVALPAKADKHKSQAAKAALSQTNMGAAARGDKLVKARPDLAEQVRLGKMTSAAAHRQLNRDELNAKLEDIEAMDAKAAEGVYDVVVIDPPWPMQKIARDVRPNQVGLDYPTMDEAELSELDIPCADDCHVWLWTTHKHLPLALRLLDTWGLKYVCTFTWHKPGGFQPVGLPQYNCEFALYARKGSPKFVDTKAFPVCFSAPRGAHSEKPEEFYEVARRVTGGRRLDMFNRRTIEGFHGWGKEVAG